MKRGPDSAGLIPKELIKSESDGSFHNSMRFGTAQRFLRDLLTGSWVQIYPMKHDIVLLQQTGKLKHLVRAREVI